MDKTSSGLDVESIGEVVHIFQSVGVHLCQLSEGVDCHIYLCQQTKVKIHKTLQVIITGIFENALFNIHLKL